MGNPRKVASCCRPNFHENSPGHAVSFSARGVGGAAGVASGESPLLYLPREAGGARDIGEHYGAVLNLDFDYVKYLDALRRDGLNLTRTFTGAYVEPPGAFNIASNTLAPLEGRFLSPGRAAIRQAIRWAETSSI